MSCLTQPGKVAPLVHLQGAQRSLAPALTAVPAKKSAPQRQGGLRGLKIPLMGDADSRAVGLLHKARVTNAIK